MADANTKGQCKSACQYFPTCHQSAVACRGLQQQVLPQHIPTSNVCLSLTLFPRAAELWATLGRKGQGPWNPLATLPEPFRGSWPVVKYSVYMSSCPSTPNPNLGPSIFPGHSKYRAEREDLFLYQISAPSLFCGLIRWNSEAPRESWILSLMGRGRISFGIDWLYPSHYVK